MFLKLIPTGRKGFTGKIVLGDIISAIGERRRRSWTIPEKINQEPYWIGYVKAAGVIYVTCFHTCRIRYFAFKKILQQSYNVGDLRPPIAVEVRPYET